MRQLELPPVDDLSVWPGMSNHSRRQLGSDGSTQQRQNYASHPFARPNLSSLGGMELVYAAKLVLRRGT